MVQSDKVSRPGRFRVGEENIFGVFVPVCNVMGTGMRKYTWRVCVCLV